MKKEEKMSSDMAEVLTEYFWIPVVQCNGSFASKCGTHGKVTRNLVDALKFEGFRECLMWCSERNETSKAFYAPEQYAMTGLSKVER